MGGNVDEKLMQKLQKLLALAGSDNENEARVAMAKAQALMAEHGVTVADVALDGSGAHVADTTIDALGRTMPPWERGLLNAVCKGFDGRCLFNHTGRRQYGKATVVASRTDIIIIRDLFERLRDTCHRQGLEYCQRVYDGLLELYGRRAPSRKMVAGSYRLGFVDTVRKRLLALKAGSTPAGVANVHGLTGKDLMVVKDKAVAQRFDRMFPNREKIGGRSINIHRAAYSQGQADGGRASLHRSVPGQSGPIGIGR